MVCNHYVPVCALMSAVQIVREAEHAFACWQRVIVAIWALNPCATFYPVRR